MKLNTYYWLFDKAPEKMREQFYNMQILVFSFSVVNPNITHQTEYKPPKFPCFQNLKYFFLGLLLWLFIKSMFCTFILRLVDNFASMKLSIIRVISSWYRISIVVYYNQLNTHHITTVWKTITIFLNHGLNRDG